MKKFSLTCYLALLPLITFAKSNHGGRDTIILEKLITMHDTVFIKDKPTSFVKKTIDFPSWITAISTVIYTIGSFLLWSITRTSIQLSKTQIKRNEELINNQSTQTFFKNFRELYSYILSDIDNREILATVNNVSIIELKRNYLGSFLINHAYEIYLMNKQGLITEEIWHTVVDDMKTLFEWDFVNERWHKIKKLFMTDFQNFVEKEFIKINGI